MVMRVCVPDDVAAGSDRLLFRTSGHDSAYREIRDWLPTAIGGGKGNHYVIHGKHYPVKFVFSLGAKIM